MKRGFSSIEMIGAVVITAVVIAIAVPNVVRSRTNANASYAKEILKSLATAADEYARAHNGYYPGSINDLTAYSKYLQEDYTNGVRNGYQFSCSWSITNYQCTATPVENQLLAAKTLVISTDKTVSEDAGTGTLQINITKPGNPGDEPNQVLSY